jgi:hypothetical protein
MLSQDLTGSPYWLVSLCCSLAVGTDNRRLGYGGTDHRARRLVPIAQAYCADEHRWLELPEKVQQQNAATAPAEISLRPTL